MGTNPFAKQSGGSSAYEDDYAEADGFIRTKIPALQFPRVGFTAGGTILAHEFVDDTDKDGNQRFWLGQTPVTAEQAREKGADPAGLALMRVLKLTVQVHDEKLRGHAWEGNTYEPVTLEDDDLIRIGWVRGSMRKALGKALADAKVPTKGWLRKAVGAHILYTRGPNRPKAPGAQGAPHTHTAVWTPLEKNTFYNPEQMDDPWASDMAAGQPGADGVPF